MPFLRRLFQIELIAQMALVLCAVLFALVFTLAAALFGDSSLLTPEGLLAAPLLAATAYGYGVLPVVLVSAPLYAALEARRPITTVAAILIGVFPGVVILLVSFVWLGSSLRFGPTIFSPIYAGLYAACGLSVGAATHLLRTWGKDVASAV